MIVAVEIAWLFLILPVFELAHFRFFSWMYDRGRRRVTLADWYLEFIRVLKRRPAHESDFYIAFARKGLLYVSLVVPLAALSTLVDGKFSVLGLLGLVFCLGIVHLLFGFTFQSNFIPLESLNRNILRSGVIFILLASLIALPFMSQDMTLADLVSVQARPLFRRFPAFGAFVNPIAFLCACIAISLYLRNWQEDEFPSPLLFRKPLQTELFGSELIAYKVARNLEYLTLYSIVTFVFLGGPYVYSADIVWYEALGFFTLKLFFVAFLTLGIHFCLPRFEGNQIYRLMFLVLVPLEIISYPLSNMISHLYQ